MPVIIDTILLNSLHQRGVPKARYPINPAHLLCGVENNKPCLRAESTLYIMWRIYDTQE